MSHLNEHGITHLRHVDLAVTDYETQRAFYRDTWGLTEVGTDSGLSYFAAEGSPEQYVVRLRQSDDKRLDLIAFGAQDRAAVDTLAAHLGTTASSWSASPASCRPPVAATASASSTSTAAPSRSPRTSRPGSTAPSRRARPSRSGSRTR